MADYKTHISWGAILAAAFIIFGLLYSFFVGLKIIAGVFSAVIIGSLLPDMDYDDGVTFKVFFGLLAVAISGWLFYRCYLDGSHSLGWLILCPTLVFVGVKFGAGYIFGRLTDHRGIFHSVPAAVLSGLIPLAIFNHFSVVSADRYFLALGVTLGYLGHLFLDEIYSSVNFAGHSIFPKKSLGSALKFYSGSRLATFLVYAGIIFFLVII